LEKGNYKLSGVASPILWDNCSTINTKTGYDDDDDDEDIIFGKLTLL
jgi:hypothetical protein